jgi:hypothetical protein
VKPPVTRPYIHFSRFRLTPRAGGGCRRELQLARILQPMEFQFISAWDHPVLSVNARLKMMFKKTSSRYWAPEFQHYAGRMHFYSNQWTKYINPSIKLAALDDPLFFPETAKALKKKGIPFIIFSQNLESLSRSQINPGFQLELFKQELELMSLADLIVTISREETSLLHNLGLPTLYLPYYPVEEIENRMKNIRQLRRTTKKKGILLIGTVNNRATREGIQHIVQYWKEHLAGKLDDELIIAGYGMDTIKSICTGPGIRFKGQINDDQLDQLLAEISLCVNYQNSGGGALTKIREMQIAGVPMAANTHSLRSHYHQAGLAEFKHVSGIKPAIAQAREWEGRIPLPQRPPESKLLQAAESLAAAHS